MIPSHIPTKKRCKLKKFFESQNGSENFFSFNSRFPTEGITSQKTVFLPPISDFYII